MYVSGAIVAFIIGFIVLFLQGLARKRDGQNETLAKTFLGALLGSAVAALLSWILVALLTVMLLGGKVWGVSDRNLE